MQRTGLSEVIYRNVKLDYFNLKYLVYSILTKGNNPNVYSDRFRIFIHNYEREEKAMRHLLLFCFSKSVFSRSNPRIFDTIEGFKNSENMYDPYEDRLT